MHFLKILITYLKCTHWVLSACFCLCPSKPHEVFPLVSFYLRHFRFAKLIERGTESSFYRTWNCQSLAVKWGTQRSVPWTPTWRQGTANSKECYLLVQRRKPGMNPRGPGVSEGYVCDSSQGKMTMLGYLPSRHPSSLHTHICVYIHTCYFIL